MEVWGGVLSLDGKKLIEATQSVELDYEQDCDSEKAKHCGNRLGQQLLDSGAKSVLEECR